MHISTGKTPSDTSQKVCQVINSAGTFHAEACKELLVKESVGGWDSYSLLGVVGGTAAGKSTVLNELVRHIAELADLAG